MLGVADYYSKCAGQEQGSEESPGPGGHPEDVPFISSSAAHTDEIEEIVITSMKFMSLRLLEIANVKVGIRATDVALGLRRIPAGFYTIVHHSASGLEWRTENKRSSVNHDVVEWSGPIPM